MLRGRLGLSTALAAGALLVILPPPASVLTGQGPPDVTCGASSGSAAPLEEAVTCLRQADSVTYLRDSTAARLAISWSLRAAALGRQVGDTRLQGFAWWRVADRYRRLTDFDSSLTYAYKALGAAGEAQDSALAVLAVTQLGDVYTRLNRADSADAFSRLYLQICTVACPQTLEYLATSSRLWSDAERSPVLHWLDSASVSAPPWVRARVADEIGLFLTEQLKQPRKGIEYHWRADSLRQADAWTLYGLGRAYRALGIPDSAVAAFQGMLDWARAEGVRWAEPYALANLGGVCHRVLHVPDLMCAVRRYDEALSLVEQLRRQLGSDQNRTAASEFAWEVYEDLTLAVLATTELSDSAWTAKVALAVSDLGRAPVVTAEVRRDRIGDWKGNAAAGEVPPFLAAVDVGTSSTFVLSYFVTADTLLTWFQEPGGRVQVHRTRVGDRELWESVQAVRAALGVAPADVRSRLRSGRAHGPDNIRLDEDVQAAMDSLGKLLLPPAFLAAVPAGADLIIVPHAFLSLVPFAALRGEPTDSLPLGVRFAIRYTPSLGLLHTIEGRARGVVDPGTRAQMLVVGNPLMPLADVGLITDGAAEGLTRLADLPGALEEAGEVAASLGGEALLGPAATETRIRSQLGAARIIHLATHAVVSENPGTTSSSFLALAPDSVNDGLLSVREILALPPGALSADLVVLSACQSAGGAVRFVEGVMGLQRAFLTRGARSVVASLWSVDDAATSLLMRRFYSYWKNGSGTTSKAEALRRAQLDVMGTPGFSNPVYWAGFQLVGMN